MIDKEEEGEQRTWRGSKERKKKMRFK